MPDENVAYKIPKPKYFIGYANNGDEVVLIGTDAPDNYLTEGGSLRFASDFISIVSAKVVPEGAIIEQPITITITGNSPEGIREAIEKFFRFHEKVLHV